MYDDLIEAISNAVHDGSCSWDDRYEAIYRAFEDAACLDDLEEFVSWFIDQNGEFKLHDV